jgi:hypothetical protein
MPKKGRISIHGDISLATDCGFANVADAVSVEIPSVNGAFANARSSWQKEGRHDPWQNAAPDVADADARGALFSSK